MSKFINPEQSYQKSHRFGTMDTFAYVALGDKVGKLSFGFRAIKLISWLNAGVDIDGKNLTFMPISLVLAYVIN